MNTEQPTYSVKEYVKSLFLTLNKVYNYTKDYVREISKIEIYKIELASWVHIKQNVLTIKLDYKPIGKVEKKKYTSHMKSSIATSHVLP